MATIDATPGSPEFLVQFIHPDRILGAELLDATALDTALGRDYYGVEPAAVAAMREEYRAAVEDAAELALTQWRPLLERMPFRPGQTIAAVGDSMTDDLQSWAYILREVLRRMFPDSAPEVVNLGRSGDTSAHLIERFRSVAALEPDWVVLMVGNNDAKAFTSAPDTPLVSPGETARNIRLLDRLASDTGANVVWLAEPRVEPALVAALDQWQVEQLSWSNDLVDATRAAVLGEVAAIDLEEVFTPDLYLPDGLHPNLQGQLTILRALLEAVAED